MLEILQNYWWVIPILLGAVLYQQLFRLFGIVLIPESKIGLLTKKFVLFGKDRSLPDGRIIALNGEAGYQAKALAPGIYFWLWPWQYSIVTQTFVIIPQGKIGLINAKDGAKLSDGRVLGGKVSCDNFQDAEAFIQNGGQRGRQSAYLTTGVYRINTHLFDVSVCDQVVVPDNKVGVITTQDGNTLDAGQIAGKSVSGHENYQNFDSFIENGGQKGLQQGVILAGTYNLNPWAVDVELTDMTEIPIGNVGVVVSFVGEDGEDVSGSDFKHGNIVAKGQKGVWNDILGPGKYPINKYTMKVEFVATTNIVLNWADARSEAHNLDKDLSTITVRSKDGFPFNLDVSQIIHVPMKDAPKVIARFGNMKNLVTQVLEPTIGNYFRNSAQDSDVIAFLSTRKQRQESARTHISEVLDQYNVQAVDTLIGDINPPESLMKPLTDRKIAEEQLITYETQEKSQVKRQSFEKSRAIADMQGELVSADQGVIIAERKADATVKESKGKAASIEIQAEANAKATKLEANAKAEKITVEGTAIADATLKKGQADAESYRLAVESMGEDNFTKFKVFESIGNNKVKITPEILINGSGGNSTGDMVSPLLGLQVLDMVKKREDDVINVTESVEPEKTEKKK